MRRFYLFLIPAILLSCSDDPPPAPPPHVTTTFVEERAADYTEITVRLYTTEQHEGGSYALTRNGLTVWEGLLAGDDTLITDTGLTASSDYSYTAYAYQNGNLVDSSDALIIHTKDTTGGDFEWEVFEFGSYNSLLRDVCILSPNDVWAVGEVYYVEPFQEGRTYNALHWDGIKWDTLKVPTQYARPDGTYRQRMEEDLFSVYAPTPNDVWFLGEYNGVSRWQNGAWNEMKPPYAEGPGTTNGVWGTSDNLTLACQYAGIRGWDGSKFYSIVNHEEIGGVDAQDAWGINDTALVIAGDMDHSDGSNIYMVVNGVATGFDSKNLNRNMVTLWFASTDLVFAGGARLSKYQHGEWSNYPNENNSGFINHIRGVAINDIFAVGDYATVLHYSGLTWQPYPFVDPDRNLHFEAVSYNGTDVWAVGKSTSTKAVILHGKRK